ncbi:UbiA prenyltransferase family [Pycnococcus provasolii]
MMPSCNTRVRVGGKVVGRPHRPPLKRFGGLARGGGGGGGGGWHAWRCFVASPHHGNNHHINPDDDDAIAAAGGGNHVVGGGASVVIRNPSEDTSPYAMFSPASIVNNFEPMIPLMRIHNYLPSALIALVGGMSSQGIHALAHPTLLVVIVLSSLVALASCLLNSYFDFAAGVDQEGPLPSGKVSPEKALFLSFVMYLACFTAIAFLDPPPLRHVVAASALITVVYTPLLKPATAIKNVSVAFVISAAAVAGSLAATAGNWAAVAKLPPIFLFLCVVAREIVMDITDVEEDADANVRTIPVRFGTHNAARIVELLLLSAACILVAGASLAAPHVLASQGLVGRFAAMGVGALAAHSIGSALTMARSLTRVCGGARVGTTEEEMKNKAQLTVDAIMRPVGAGTIALAYASSFL